MSIREPRDLVENYLGAQESARRLRALADQIEGASHARPLVKWRIDLSFWNPAWKEPPKSPFILTGQSFASQKCRRP
jgi:hypothetical protein